jgi:hypothetical protein
MSIEILNSCGIKEILADGTPPLPVFYQRNGSPPEIVDLVGLSNKRFGTEMEKIVCKITGCQKIPDKVGETGWDCKHEETNNYIEIKSSRYWQSIRDWKWQHILADHEWSHLILVGIDFKEIKLFLLTKDIFMHLIEKGLVTQQGGAGGQGCWFEYKKTSTFLHPITGNTLEEIKKNTTYLLNKYPSSRRAKTQEEINEALQKGNQKINNKKAEKKANPKKEEKKSQENVEGKEKKEDI